MVDDPDMEVAREQASTRRRRTWLRIGGGVAASIAVLVGGIWLARKPIAIHFIAQALRDKGVAATYNVIRIGPRTQRLEHLVLGDPKNPDLTADWVEVDLGYSFSGIKVTRLRTGTVAVNVAYRNGKLELGSIDKLLGEGTGKAELPDIMAQLGAVRVRLATDGGTVDLALDGVGNLRSGFAGALNATSPGLALGGCTLGALGAKTKIATDDGEIRIKGPVTARDLICSDTRFALSAPRIDADLRTDAALSDVNGAFALAAGEARLPERSLSRASGLVTIKGSTEAMTGSAALSAATSALGFATTGPIKLGGDFALRPSAKDRAYSYAATLTAEEIRPTTQAEYAQIEAPVAGTPLAPLAHKLAEALRSASHANRLTVAGRLSGAGEAMQLLVNGAQFSAASGARVALGEGSRFALNLPKGDWTLDGGLETGGGGLPDATVTMASRPDVALAGKLVLADYRAGTARLGLTPVSFLRTSDGAMRVNTTVSLDGPIGDGGVTGLEAPLDIAITSGGTVRLPRDCTPIRWRTLRISSLAIDPARLEICGLGASQARIATVALRGRMGDSPFALNAKDARFALDTGRFYLNQVDARIGAGENPVLMQAGAIEGALGKGGVLSGTLAQGHAIIGPVPLDLSAIAGKWQFADGALALDGALRVTDRQSDARFKPIDARDVRLTLVDSKIAAKATLVQPDRKVDVASLSIAHDLGSGNGSADFALANLRFGRGIQPDDLTSMALGVVANVEGLAEGAGRIRWSSEGVTASTGTFSTQDMSFAAAFGPVTGFATNIQFTDLLALKTAPHQRMTMKQVSAGVDVYDGVVDYALLSNERAQIEGGRWPFSGGTLELLPTTLNLDSRQPRLLTFRLVGLDAAAFVAQLDISNVAVTGTLDGVFPMVFDEKGGRIEGGLLVARQAGMPPLILSSAATANIPPCTTDREAGALSYVGPVSDAELGTMGKLAFNVLKHLGYKCLVVRLDGALDGEFLTQLSINGINL